MLMLYIKIFVARVEHYNINGIRKFVLGTLIQIYIQT